MFEYVVASVCWSFVYLLVGVALGLAVREIAAVHTSTPDTRRHHRHDDS